MPFICFVVRRRTLFTSCNMHTLETIFESLPQRYLYQIPGLNLYNANVYLEKSLDNIDKNVQSKVDSSMKRHGYLS